MDHEAPDVASFYSLAGAGLTHASCQGTACFVSQRLCPGRWHKAVGQSPRVYCLGKCYNAPAGAEDQGRPRIEVLSHTPVVLERVAAGGARSFNEYRQHRGIEGLQKALILGPQKTIAEIEASQLRGRGGAGFPTGAKWLAVAGPTGTAAICRGQSRRGGSWRVHRPIYRGS